MVLTKHLMATIGIVSCMGLFPIKSITQTNTTPLSLADAISKATQNNRAVTLAKLDEQLAASNYKQMDAIYLPQVGLSYTAMSTNNPLNALVGQNLTVSFHNLTAGKYNLAVYDVLGKKVVEKSITHIGGNATEQLTINSHLAASIYTVRATNSNGVSYQS